jgi:hypothetical protein
MELTSRFNQIVGPLIALLVMIYFGYHIVQGERGLFSWMRLRQNIWPLFNQRKRHSNVKSTSFVPIVWTLTCWKNAPARFSIGAILVKLSFMNDFVLNVMEQHHLI